MTSYLARVLQWRRNMLGTRGSYRNDGSHQLDALLRAQDLDVLGEVRHQLHSLTESETARLRRVITAWKDRQAIANLLFHPEVIPEDLRFGTLARALRSTDVPYFQLAATVAMQGMPQTSVPEEHRQLFADSLVGFLGSRTKVLASRASVTLFGWSQEQASDDLLIRMLAAVPVENDTVSHNVFAAVLARHGKGTPQEFEGQTARWDIPPRARTALLASHRENLERTARGEIRGKIMTCPLFSYIPNLSEFLGSTTDG